MKSTNTYLMKALDAYPFDLEETYESLTYALSYDEKDVAALCLMGRLYAEQLQEYEIAVEYFEAALVQDINAHFVYPYLIFALSRNCEYEKAIKLIEFGLTVKGTDKAVLRYYESVIWEAQSEFKKALKAIKEAKKLTFNDRFMTFLNEAKTRIKSKKPKKSKKKSKTKSKKKKGK